MTNEEAIKHLGPNEIYTDDWEEAILMAKEAVEKQVPKEPKDDGWIYCPVCGRDILMDRFKYCPDCGQRIDWESVENQ